MKFKGDLGVWIVPPSIDEKVIRRELDKVGPYEQYVVGGELLADLTGAAKSAQGAGRRARGIRRVGGRRRRRQD